ncbi:MAG: PAS domain S-box protein, partial [Burkholderiaceae bacterium]
RSSTERVAVSVRWAIRMIAACALYVGAALLGVALALDGSIVSLFWLPTGIAVAALVCWGVPIVPPLVFTVFVLQLWLGSPPWAAAVMALGGVGGPWIASRVLVKRGLDPEFGSAADFRSLGYAAALGMLLPSTTGVAMLVAGGRMPAESALIAWIGWYAGDTLGVLLAAPLLIAAHSAWRSGTLLRRPDGRPEPGAMIAVALLLAAGVGLTLLSVDPNDASGLAAMFAMQLAAAAAAAWFGVVGAWATLVAVALAVVVPASMGVGPFVRSVPNEGQWVGWLFLLMVTASLVLILSARRRLQGVQSALELRERQLRAMFEQSNAALSVSERGRYVMVNDAFCRMVGYRRDELIGKPGSEITHPDDGHLNAAALRRWVERGRGSGVLFEKRYLHKDGRTVWSRITISVIESPQAAVPQVVAVKLDITEHKRVEASLRRQREQLSLVFDATGAGIWDHDMLTGRSFFSDSYLRMLGYPPGSSLHSAVRDQSRLHPDDRGRIVQLQRRMLDERVPFDAEYRLARADGGWMWVHGRGFAAWDDTGRPVRHYGTIADISARKAAEAALVDSRARLSAIIDSALDAIVTIDEAGRIVLFNPAAEALFGRNASDLLGRPILPLMPPRMRADALARLVSIADAPGARSHGGAGHARMPMVHA